MSRAVLVAILVAMVVAVVYFGVDPAKAALAIDDRVPKPPPVVPPPPPEPLFKLLPPGQEKTATVHTSTGPVVMVQKYDTSQVRSLFKSNIRPVPL